MRLVIAGHGADRPRLDALVSTLDLRDRVTFTGDVSDRELVDLYANALAVVYPPFDEDYGYVTLEAFLARKPIVTTTDAGGPLEFVEEGVNGLVADPVPAALAAAIARLANDRPFARRLGEAGRFTGGRPTAATTPAARCERSGTPAGPAPTPARRPCRSRSRG